MYNAAFNGPNLKRDGAIEFVHLTQESRNDGRFPGAHLPHNSHQLTTTNTEVDTERGTRGRGELTLKKNTNTYSCDSLSLSFAGSYAVRVLS